MSRTDRPVVHRAVLVAAALAMMVALLPAISGPAVGATLDTTPACPSDEVPDGGFVDTGPPHAASVDCLAWYGIVEGKEPGTFDPRGPVLRGQAASIQHRLLTQLDGIELPDRDASFSDVRGGPHRAAIETLASFDPPVLQGFDDGTFEQYTSITRGQFSSVLARVLDEVADQADTYDRLPDADYAFDDAAPSVHRDAIARLSDAGVINGYPDGTFRAAETISREQVASLTVRSMVGLVEAGLLAPPDVPDHPDDPDLDVELTLTQVAEMDEPIAGAVGPDGVLYLAERAGTLHPLTDDGVGAAVVDITAETTTDSERGLLGVAFSADGTQLYLSFTDLDGDTTLDAIGVAADGTIDADDRRTVFTQEQPFGNHNGGDVKVGPDGLLYLGIGDGGGGGDPLEAGQDLSTALGSMIRIDPQGGDPYAIPADNPFVGDDGVVEETWAYGLRNPWRFSFDRATGDLWIADVGQSTREEVNVVPAGTGAGANFGWNLMEGTLPFDGGEEPDDHVPPVYEYENGGPEGCSITGGYVYRGEAIPELVGAYLYSDFCVGDIRGLVVAGGEVLDQGALGIAGSRVIAFAEDAAGELYVLDQGGEVQRIDPA